MQNESNEANDQLLHTEILLKVHHLRQRGYFSFKEILDLYLLAGDIEDSNLRASSQHVINLLQKEKEDDG